MPISGYQEPCQASSDSLAGVPIKKRKFPLVALSSPSSQLSSSFLKESGLPNKERPVSESESSSLGLTPDASSLVTRADSLDSRRDRSAYITNEGNSKTVETIGSTVQPARVKVENSSTVEDAWESKAAVALQLELSTQKLSPGEGTGSVNSIHVGKSTSTRATSNNEKYPSMRVSSNTETLLTSKESLEQQFQCPKNGGNCMPDEKPKDSKVLVNTGMRLKIEESSDRHNEEIYQEQKSCSLELGLCQTEIRSPISSKKGSSVQSKSVDMKSVVGDDSDRAIRSHWDLNTSMDTWDGHVSDPRTKLQMESIYLKSNCPYEQKLPVFVRKQGDGGATGTSVSLGKDTGESDSALTLSSSSRKPCEEIGKGDQTKNLSYFSKLPYKHLDPGMNLHLQLSPSYTIGSCIKAESSNQTAKHHSLTGSREGSELTLSIKATPQTNNVKLGDCRTVKPEPIEETSGGMLKTVDGSRQIILSQSTIKLEPSDLRIADESRVKSIGNPNVKPEPVVENCMKHVKEGLLGHLGKQNSQENITDRRPPGRLSEASIGVSDLVPESIGSARNESLISSTQTSCVDGVNASLCESTTVTEQCNGINSDGGVADNDNEDKTKKSIGEEMNDNDGKSDGINDTLGPTDSAAKFHDVVDDYEDGEVREATHASNENTDHRDITSDADCQCSTSAVNENATSAPSGEQNSKTGIAEGKDTNYTLVGWQDDKTGVSSKVSVTNPDETENCCKISVINPDTLNSKSSPLLETLSTDVLKSVATKKKPTKLLRKVSQNTSNKEGPKFTGIVSDQAEAATKGFVAASNDKALKTGESSKAEPFLCEEADKDVNCKVNRRIINLPRNSSSCNVVTKPASGRSLSSRTEGDRYSEKSSKLHSRGSRDESFKKGPHKFQRVRDQDQPNGIFGSDSFCARGRFDAILDTSREEWALNRDYATEHNNNTSASRFSGPRSAIMVAPSEHEPDSYAVRRDGPIFNAGRAGRRLANNELLDYSCLPSRRRSPAGIDLGPVPLGLRTCEGPMREVSPDRFLGDGSGSAMMMMRHEENLMRGLSDEMDSLECSQSQYERDDPYVRRDKSFSPIQRRGTLRISHMHSKSPPRARNRSPDSWSSPRKRSDGAGRLPLFKVERMRSPHQRLGFNEDMAGRRQRGSPSFIPQFSTDMRDIGLSRHHEAGRSFMSTRNPADRVLRRSNNRYDMVDPRGRTEEDDYLEPMHSGRFHEFAGNECLDDEEHKMGERYRHVHSFRPFNVGSEVEGFHYVEDGDRPFRFCPESETEFHERVSPRGFEGRIKNRLGNHPQRLRSMEEEENNLRFCGHRWQEAGFSDERLRRRF